MARDERYTVQFSEGSGEGWHVELLGKFVVLKEAQQAVAQHRAFKKSWFGRKGTPSRNNPNQTQRYYIWDNEEVLCCCPIY